MKLWWIAALVALVPSCDRHEEAHDHGHDGEHAEHDEGILCTRWSEDFELFVEVDRPKPGQQIGYHAHVTVLAGFQPARTGSLEVEWRDGDRVVVEARADSVARPGIFTPTSDSPPAGDHGLVVSYSDGERSATFDCGTIAVGTAPDEHEAAATLAFTKEQQWVVPFATALSVTRRMAREVELPAVVEPAGTDQLTISAPTSGRFFHNPKLSLAEGLHIDAGDMVGSISPTVAGDDFSELNSAVDEASIAKEQAAAEVARLEPLVAEGLLPEKRLTAAKNELARIDSKLRAARKRLARVVAPGGAGGLSVTSSLGGVVTEILVQNGEPVEPGAPLIRIGGERSRWLRARFVMRPDHELSPATVVAVRTPSGERRDVRGKARLLSQHPIVDPRTQLATLIAEVKLGDDDEPSHELRSGTPVVLLLSVGEPLERVAVPRGALVDINTLAYVFVQVDGEHFDKRRVSVGVADHDFVEIAAGVRSGERVVTTGGYDIHLVSAIGAVESHRH